MKLLLDTHIFVWYFTADDRLSDGYRLAIEEPTNEVYMSVVSMWECCIKYGLGKMPLPEPPEVLLPRMRRDHEMLGLDIDEGCVQHLPTLPGIHRDPFDRMLVCQALHHGLNIVSADPQIAAYPVQLLTA